MRLHLPLFYFLTGWRISIVSSLTAQSILEKKDLYNYGNNEVGGSCDINCQNNGRCELIGNTNIDELKFLVQSGQMIQSCKCPYGYSGMGCELIQQKCDVSTMRCPNGRRCQYDDEKQIYHCDCAIADNLSKFAGQMCRKTYTEYCSINVYDPENTPLSFCTNGGKCKGDIIAARVAPGDTSVNAEYEHVGCICPPEFYGPHCEFMHHIMPATLSDETVKLFADPLSYSSKPYVNTDGGEKTSKSSQSIQDMINKFNGKNSSTDTNNNISQEERGITDEKPLWHWLVLGGAAIVTVTCMIAIALLYRHRRKRRRTIKEKRKAAATRSKKKSSTTTTKKGKHPSKRPSVDKTSRSSAEIRDHNINKQKSPPKSSDKKPTVLLPSQGTADLTPFVLESDDEEEDDRTLETDTWSSQYGGDDSLTREASSSYGEESSLYDGGSWSISSISRHTNSKSNINTSSKDRAKYTSGLGINKNKSRSSKSRSGSSSIQKAPPTQASYVRAAAVAASGTSTTYVLDASDDEDNYCSSNNNKNYVNNNYNSNNNSIYRSSNNNYNNKNNYNVNNNYGSNNNYNLSNNYYDEELYVLDDDDDEEVNREYGSISRRQEQTWGASTSSVSYSGEHGNDFYFM